MTTIMQDVFTKNYLDVIKNNAKKRICEITEEVFGKNYGTEIEFKEDGFEVTLFGKAYGTIYEGGITYRNGKQTDIWASCSYDNSDDDFINRMHEDSANKYLTEQLIEVGKKFTQAGFQNFKLKVETD